MALQVELVSPERILWSGEADMVVARTSEGDIAFLTGHAPFIGALGIGAVSVTPTGGGSEVKAAVHGGFVEVSDNRVTVLSDVAELAGDIDVARAERALAEAERAMATEDAEADARLRRARLRVELGRG